MSRKHLCFLILFFFSIVTAYSQKPTAEKYPSLLWEITGNGLTRPSFLFGTMHVSSKLAFHLSDSFYQALRSVDEVALELNPEVWQGQMARLDKLKENYASFVQQGGNDLITENTFRLQNYVDELTAALRTEPSIVNNLLYRSYKSREDFEEDTFLDMYIYQTGRKMGKKAAGVEDYYQAEKLVLEAYGAMAKEKKKKNFDLDGDNIRDLSEKMQNAYRRGDLDLMDSLDNLMERSEAFREMFLYKRNEIQANSIDSIIRKASLFAGVGAAHLPGSRGVIELLRKKGYTLRPVKIADKDGIQKSEIDSIKVPVIFQKRTSEDNFYSVDVPGELFNISQEYPSADRRQFSDMSNGSYYIVTRVQTHAAFLNQPEDKVLKKVDSVLYENIPGKILSRKGIMRNNYPGYDITARTRRGDLQRYNIFITPFEILIFKMSGKDNYVSGVEAERFFSSITLKEQEHNKFIYTPTSGGFQLSFPQAPHQYYDHITTGRYEYEAIDKAGNNAYLVMKRPVYNFNFLDEDDFYLDMMEESFRNPDYFDTPVSRKQIRFNGKTALQVTEKLKDGSLVNAIFFISGPDHFVIAERVSKPVNTSAFFNSFRLQPYRYPPPVIYTDTFLNARVHSGIIPEIDAGLRTIIEQSSDDVANGYNYSGYISYWPKVRNGVFKSDATGQMVAVEVQEFPKYFYIQDSAAYWQKQLNELRNKHDMNIGSLSYTQVPGMFGMRLTLEDTGSSRTITRMVLVKNNYKYIITGMSDSTDLSDDFVRSFFSTFQPLDKAAPRDLYSSRLPLFFNDLFSTDSLVRARAQQAIPNVYFGINGVPYIDKALNNLNISEQNYYEIKSKLIAELGFIKDTSGSVVPLLKKIYDRTADTSLFQNEVIKALARLQTTSAYNELKYLLLQDPPVFDNNYDMTSLFASLGDSLELSASLFPDILQLSQLDDYKDRILSLLVKLVDSNLINKSAYEKYYPGILIDAKVALKKQKNRDDKRLQLESKNTDMDPVRMYNNVNVNENTLANYAILLMPFYERKDVRQFFAGLLSSSDERLKINIAVLLLKNKLPVSDSLIKSLAANDKYRGLLFNKLVKNHIEKDFPSKYYNQQELARSYIVMENDYDRLDSLALLSKKTILFKGKPGVIYFYKYRIQSGNDWKIAMTGFQPVNENEVNAEPQITLMTDVKIRENEPLEPQLQAQFKRSFYGLYKSGKNFYSGNDASDFRN